jgi:hypothetical protein
MYPAAAGNTPGLFLVTAVFAVATLTTMLILVFVGCWGLARARNAPRMGAVMDRYAHALAGAGISTCAVLMLTGF